MAYTRVRLKLTDTDFPLLSEFAGRTVLIPGPEERVAEVEENHIGLLYCENVMPSNEGLKSVDFTIAIPALVVPDGSYLSLIQYTYAQLEPFTYADLANVALPTPYAQWGLDFVRILEVRGTGQIRAYIGITTSGVMFISTPSVTSWTTLNNEGWNPSLDDVNSVSIAVVNTGDTTDTYICLPRFKIMKVDIATKLLRNAVFKAGSNIDQSKVLGIVSSYNYLILHDGSNLQWSSAFDPLDFSLENSLITGAGFGTPIGLQGKITALITNPAGFTVYSDVNAIDVDWSGNTRFPWVFRPIPNSAGIPNIRSVMVGEDNINVAWTNQGLQSLTPQNAKPIFPEVTDFLTFGKIETYNHTTNVISVQQGKLKVDIGYAGARYVIISYGLATGPQYTQALIFDIALKRWGKVLIDHVDTVDYRIGNFNTPRSGIGFMNSDGQVSVIDFSDLLCSTNILQPGNFSPDFCTPGYWNETLTEFQTNALSFNLTGAANSLSGANIASIDVYITFYLDEDADANVEISMGAETINLTPVHVLANFSGHAVVMTATFAAPHPTTEGIGIMVGFPSFPANSHIPVMTISQILVS